jgi:quercetin dioxygenase-like cupin family protein
MKSSLLSVLMFSAVLWPAATFAQSAPDAMAKAINTYNMKWEPLGDSAFEISILYTNPTTQATYLVIRGPGNQHVPRHWHSSNESITVVKGTFVVAHDGSGDKNCASPWGFCLYARKNDPRGVDR